MKTQPKVAVVILALLAATAARGDNGGVFVCPASIGIIPIPPPPPSVYYLPGKGPDPLTAFQVGTSGKLDFKVAVVNPRQSLECFYTENKDPGVPAPNTPGWVSIKSTIPNGMACTVNRAKPMEFDCIPIGNPGTTVQPFKKR